MKKKSNIADGLLTGGFGVVLLIYALYNHTTGVEIEWSMSAYLFPVLLSIFSILISISFFMSGRHSRESEASSKFVSKKLLMMLSILFIYYLVLEVLTFVPSTIILLSALLFLLGEKRIWMICIISVSATLLIYFLFSIVLNVRFP